MKKAKKKQREKAREELPYYTMVSPKDGPQPKCKTCADCGTVRLKEPAGRYFSCGCRYCTWCPDCTWRLSRWLGEFMLSASEVIYGFRVIYDEWQRLRRRRSS